MDANKKKREQIHKLWREAVPHDNFIRRFFTNANNNMLDEKIQVLTDIIAGKPRDEIPNYYKVLEKYPADPNELWD